MVEEVAATWATLGEVSNAGLLSAPSNRISTLSGPEIRILQLLGWQYGSSFVVPRLAEVLLPVGAEANRCQQLA